MSMVRIAGFVPLRPTLALGLAHAVAVVAVSYSHYFLSPPSRQLWFWLELLVAGLVWWPASQYARNVLRPAFESLALTDRRWFVGIPVALGALTTAWWSGQFVDNLWIHQSNVRPFLQVVLAVGKIGVLAAGFAGLLALTVQICRFGPEAPDSVDRPTIPRPSLGAYLTFIVFLLAANLFVVWCIRSERIVYYWDYMNYWTRTAAFASEIRDHPPAEVWDHFRHGVQDDDYGPLPSLLPACVAAVFGGDRLVYVLAVTNLYLVAVAVAAVIFVRRFAPSGGTMATAIPLLGILFAATVWVPLLRGYLDIGGAALATLVLLVYLNRPAGGLRWTDVLSLSILLAAMALFRRWYCFSVVAFLLLAGIDTGFATVRGWVRHGWREGIRRAGPLALVGFWLNILVGVFATPWVRRVLTTDYADAYFAYKNLGSFGERVWAVVNNYGSIIVAAYILAFAVLAACRETRRVAFVVGGMPPVMLWHMLRTQDPGLHHCYLFLPAIVLLPSLLAARWLGGRPAVIRRSVVGVLAAWGVAAMAVMFVPEARPLYRYLRPAVSRLYCPPMTRNDLPEFARMLRAADDAAASTRRGRVTIVASSPTINQTMFKAADRSLQRPLFAENRVLYTTEVDRVNGFPLAVFEADVVVVAWPPQTHLRPEEQQSIVLAAERIHSGTGFGRAFDRLPGEFNLEGGVTVSLYRRERPIEPTDLNEFVEQLRKDHPTCTELFTPPPGIGKWPRER